MDNIMDVLILITNLLIILIVMLRFSKRFRETISAKHDCKKLILQYNPLALFAAEINFPKFRNAYILFNKENVYFISRDDTTIIEKAPLSRLAWYYIENAKKCSPFYLAHITKNIFIICFGLSNSDYGLKGSIICAMSTTYAYKFNKYARKYNDFEQWISDNIPANPKQRASNLRK